MRHLLTWVLLCSCPALWSQSPLWSTTFDSIWVFSSPQAIDLNFDGTQDIVLGGGNEGLPLSAGVIALDGATGNELWRVPCRDQIFGTALFADINAHPAPEIFIGGRDGVFFCIDGSNGNVLWEFWPDSLGPPSAAGWRQFYNPQWIPDVNSDGVEDLLLSNGGAPGALAYDSIRPPGKLCILSAMDGTVLAEATVPDAHETYFSPLLLDSGRIVFGTGGETVRGKLWQTTLTDLLAGDISTARILLNDTLKGFIPVPSLADLDGDGHEDLIVPRLNSGLHALRGTDFSPLWSLHFPGYENYVSPAIGQFTGGPEPDVFGILARGQWAFYSDYLLYLVDGGTGQVVWTDTATVYQMSQPNAIDWDGDGWDEILLLENRDVGWATIQYRNQFQVIDFQSGLSTPFASARVGTNFFSTPLITDLDGDQELEVVYAYSPVADAWNGLLGARLERLGLGFFRVEIAWPGFMGRDRDGRYHPPVGTAVEEGGLSELRIYPNPARDFVAVESGEMADWELWSLDGRRLVEARGSDRLELNGLAAGMYVLRVELGEMRRQMKVVVE